MAVEKFKRYDFKKCCPDLKPQCDDIAPLIDFTVVKPSSSQNIDGQISIKFNGLYSRYNISWSDGFVGSVFGGVVRNNLKPGLYTASISAINNPDCVWSIVFEVPAFEDLTAELYYRDLLDSPVPQIIVPKNLTEEKTKYYWNDNKILKRGSTGETQCYELVISGGTAPYKIKWEDFKDYLGVVPSYLTSPSPSGLGLKQTSNTGVINVGGVLQEQRPPIVLDKGKVNESSLTEACINLAVINGNGWVRITVVDSTFPAPLSLVLWLYLKQSPIV